MAWQPRAWAAHTLDKTSGFPDQRFTLPVGTSRILLLDGRNCHHSAVIGLTAQPPKDDAFKMFGVKAIRLRATSRDTAILVACIT